VVTKHGKKFDVLGVTRKLQDGGRGGVKRRIYREKFLQTDEQASCGCAYAKREKYLNIFGMLTTGVEDKK
jgi:hypothetical protein